MIDVTVQEDFIEPLIDGDATLLGVLDRLLERGVVVQGELRVTVAGVELLEIGLKVLLAATTTADAWRAGTTLPGEVSRA